MAKSYRLKQLNTDFLKLSKKHFKKHNNNFLFSSLNCLLNCLNHPLIALIKSFLRKGQEIQYFKILDKIVKKPCMEIKKKVVQS